MLFYLSNISLRWYFHDLNRLQAENLLESYKEPGVFLVRPSQNSDDSLSLSITVVNENSLLTKHCKIFKAVYPPGAYYLDKDEMHSSIESLLKHYKSDFYF